MAPILKLTFAEKEEIEIQGILYPVKLADSISLEASLAMDSLQGNMSKAKAAIDAGKYPSQSEIAALGKMSRDLCKELIEAPESITDRLTDFQRMEILKSVFTGPARQRSRRRRRRNPPTPPDAPKVLRRLSARLDDASSGAG
jgi:hypothetical protein